MSERDVRINYIAARINAGLSQEEAAKKLGISVYTLANYENGKTVPTWSTHIKMSECYQIPSEMLCPPKN